MSLEQALKENTETMRELIAALGASGGAAGGGKSGDTETKTTRTRRSSKNDDDGDKGGSKYNAEQVKAAAVKVKDELGTKTAKQLIKDAGKADELAAIKPENYDAFIAACEKALNSDGNDDGNDDGDGL